MHLTVHDINNKFSRILWHFIDVLSGCVSKRMNIIINIYFFLFVQPCN